MHGLYKSQLDIQTNAEMLRVLGHETRLNLLFLLIAGEHSVGELEVISGIGQPGLSQQLAVLRKVELVQTRRVNRKIYYQVDSAQLHRLADLLLLLAGSAPATQPLAKRADSDAPTNSAGAASRFARLI